MSIVVVFTQSVMADDIGTAFTYQGELIDGGTPVTDDCDFEFTLWDDTALGNQLGPVVATTLSVAGGVFMTSLDFGADVFQGSARYLDISVCCPSVCSPQQLSPRVAMTPVPYALSLPALHTTPGQLPDSPNIIGGHHNNTVAADSSGSTIGGGSFHTLTGDHNSIAGGWGNSMDATNSTISGGNNNSASGGGHAMTVGGGQLNVVEAQGATVGGGEGNFSLAGNATVSGGLINVADGQFASVGGGNDNRASGIASFVTGGSQNVAGGDYSFAGGRRAKVRDAAASGDANGDEGSFVWADTNDFDFPSPFEVGFIPGPNQLLARVTGGAVFVTEIDAFGGSAKTIEFSSGGDIAASGTIKSGNSITIDGTAGSENINSTGDLDLRTNGSSRILLDDASGHVGIGTSDPFTTLYVSGNEGGFGNTTITATSSQAGGLAAIEFAEVGNPLWAVGKGFTNQFQITEVEDTRLMIQPGGNVGIGTTDPVTTLYVSGNEGGFGNTTITATSTQAGGLAAIEFAEVGNPLWAVGKGFTNQFQITEVEDTRLMIQPGGNVGIGTTNPITTLYVSGNEGGDGNTTITATSTQASGIAAIEFADIGNPLWAVGKGAANQFQITEVEDTRLVIQPGGNVGIGTESPTSKLHVNGNAQITGSVGINGGLQVFGLTVQGDAYVLGGDTYTDGDVGIGDDTPDAALDVVGDIHYTGTITDVSDRRLKENIAPVENALAKTMKLHGVYFTMKDRPEVREVGMIAQDVEQVLPEAVSIIDPEEGYLGVSYTSVIPVLVEAIKDQQEQIDAQQKTIERLESQSAELASLKSQVAELLQLSKAGCKPAAQVRVTSSSSVGGAK
jgi:hypothetical protein